MLHKNFFIYGTQYVKTQAVNDIKRFKKQKFIVDLTPGVIVDIVALPLAIAFGLTSGVAPQQGIITTIIAGIESLLSAIVADGMIGGKHRSNMELIAQGVANLISPLFEKYHQQVQLPELLQI